MIAYIFLTLFLGLLCISSSYGFKPNFHHQNQPRSFRLAATIPLEVAKFDEIVSKSTQVCLVDFYADWCGPCKLMAPIFEQLSEEMPDVKFVKVDTDVHEDVVERFNIQGLPLFGLFVNGKMVASHAGALKKDLLKEFVVKNAKSTV